MYQNLELNHTHIGQEYNILTSASSSYESGEGIGKLVKCVSSPSLVGVSSENSKDIKIMLILIVDTLHITAFIHYVICSLENIHS